MKRDFSLKRRESKNLPPEKLYEILCKIYPEEHADEIYQRLMEQESLKESET